MVKNHLIKPLTVDGADWVKVDGVKLGKLVDRERGIVQILNKHLSYRGQPRVYVYAQFTQLARPTTPCAWVC